MKSFIVSTQSTNHNEWLAFSTWYSIHRNAPDVKVGVIFPRGNKTYQYNWLRKCDVPFIVYHPDCKQENVINQLNLKADLISIIPDYVMMVRSDGLVPEKWTLATSNEAGTFIDIRKVGKFNLDEWAIKEKTHPFYKTSQLINDEQTINEQKVISLWKQMGQTFDFINRN